MADAMNVALHDLHKRFGLTRALDGLSLEARGGEILGVAGPNGAGKSTMVGVLAGETPLDAGRIEIGGTTGTGESPRVAVIHQEPQLFGNLTVAENLAVGNERFLLGRVDLDYEERALMAAFGLEAAAERTLAGLPLSQRQRVEILRGLLADAHVVLFDEPNSALTPEESLQLFGEMHRLADSGKVVLLVSHRLQELAEHCDRVAVIRDGRVRAELSGEEMTPEGIAEALVAGTVLADRSPSHVDTGTGPEVLRVDDWTHRRLRFADVRLAVHAGEVVAITGVEGAGGRELVRSLAGLEPAHGRRTATGDVDYVTGDRAGSLFPNLSIEENVVLRTAPTYCGRLGWWRRRSSRAAARRATQRFGVKTPDLDDPIGSLSGGNQQKVAIAAALLTEPAVLVLEEPTRGVDIGAKADIYTHLRLFADAGGAVVLFCTEESEVFECADRVVAVAAGHVVAERRVDDFMSVEALAAFLARASSKAPSAPEQLSIQPSTHPAEP